ncbi:pimeloyl-ACP methyl ester carboxylesterase [Rhodococcus sp. 27YEA15]|uniref:alpha/beta fold hydrolase n=1 Tax=Rhodococcus sp. 27YEA15 TaxID=3156259 RepID=UPI003C7CF641
MSSVHVQEWGSGDRVAVLIHGLGNSRDSWWQVGPALADEGYRVLAVDLPGHGKSAPLQRYTVDALAQAVIDSVPERPDLVVGHSLGGLVLAAAVDTLLPGRAVYVDPAWRIDSAPVPQFAAQKEWALADLEQAYPHWNPESRNRKLAALADWDTRILEDLPNFVVPDPDKAIVPSLVLLADPSSLIPAERAEQLRADGFDVVTVAGTGHTVHLDDVDAFLAALRA